MRATHFQDTFAEAVRRFNEAGCVQWVKHTLQPVYVKVMNNRGPCWADVGYNGSTRTIRLAENGCLYVDSILHEMLHITGTMHEQNRIDDRNKVISFNWPNVPIDSEYNFEGYYLNNAREYDLGSVMQYGLTNGNKTVMRTKDPDLAYLTRNKHGLSYYDIAELNAFYKCADNCTNPPVCKHEGFVKQVRGNCSCECVDGLQGRDCSKLDTSSGCGGFIDLSTGGSELIDMYGYEPGLKCTWLIKGPESTKIEVNIIRLDLPYSTQGVCYHFVEVRDYLSGSTGKLICGNSGGETFTKQNLGPTNMMIVRFYSDRYDTVSPENGFELSVTAAPSACSSSPCKYPASCVDGVNTKDYVCLCTKGYSGTNCDRVTASATVGDSFEEDFTTLMTHLPRTDIKWSTNKDVKMNGIQTTASDGYLMATLRDYFFTNNFNFGQKASIVTSVIFETIPPICTCHDIILGADRCLRFDYGISDFDLTGRRSITVLIVKIYEDPKNPHRYETNMYNQHTGNKWTTVEIDLPAVKDLQVAFDGSYGPQNLILDNIRITPLLCNANNPCDDVFCQNGGECEVSVDKTKSVSFRCNCQFGFFGKLCEHYICNKNSCGNGICFPLSSSTYSCKCDDGWSGDNCEKYVCGNVECNQGRCDALSETETRCICDNGWEGEFCDITNPCDYMPCKHGVCEVMSTTEARCVCNSIHWIGKYCDIRMFTPRR
ncbi:uncharacterized protein LOC128174017 [Crassostrea angulata]|uniref:uncharacterized protein LOC128174017 n=1 Tax=Magallana angulata TaxID=2784310 RepID=UPI0022B0B606|nr:uncharacterized protein LOC128174017 [Crassostrea angulata]